MISTATKIRREFPRINAEDIEVMAKTLYGEARGEGLEGLIAVAHVILNRYVIQYKFKKSIKEICQLPKQFSCWNYNDPHRFIFQDLTLRDDDYRRCYGVACLVIYGDFPDPTGGATLYYNPSIVTPNWNWAKTEETVVIKHHRFLREKFDNG